MSVEWVRLDFEGVNVDADTGNFLNGEIGVLVGVRFYVTTWRQVRRWKRIERKRMLNKVRHRDHSPRYEINWVTCEVCNRDTSEPYTTDDGTTLCGDCYEAILEGD